MDPGNKTIEKTSITLKMLIDSGILSSGWKLVSINDKAQGTLNSDGTITVNYQGEKRAFEFLSGAARFVENRSLNGWLYWQIVQTDERVSLSFFRERFLELTKR